MSLAFFHIAHQTFRQCLRQPLFLVLQLISLGIIGLHPIIALFVFREQQKLVTDGALATTLLFGWISAIICSSDSISREIDTGTVLLIASKPVHPAIFILAKILGILGVLVLYVWINGIGTLLAVRIAQDQFNLEKNILSLFFGCMVVSCCFGAFRNFASRSSFPASSEIALAVLFTLAGILVYWLPEYSSGYQWGSHLGYSKNLIRAIVLILFAVLILGILSTTLAVFLHIIANFFVCGLIFFWGLISDYLYFQLINLNKNQLIQFVYYWPLILIFPLMIAWVTLNKRLQSKNRKTTKLNVGAVVLFFVLLALSWYSGASAGNSPISSWIVPNLVDVCYPLKDFLAEVAHAIVPNWQLFWMADALVAQQSIPIQYISYAFAYTIFYLGLFTSLSLIFFNFREIGKQMVRP